MSTSDRPRLVHLGVGGFARAHTVPLTADAGGWDIVVFTGRSPEMAGALTAQDGRYGLVVRGPQTDEVRVVDAITAAHPASDLATLETLLADPATAVVTLTITEKGYSAGTDPATSAPARLARGLRARREAGGDEPVALISCDNLPGNGVVLRRAVVAALEAEGDRETIAWLTDHVDVISTMVDRITPAAGPEEMRIVEEQTGFADRAPVVTEPFYEWVIEDAFQGKRPAWETAGAVLTDDVAVHERRKLRFLNGAHSLMACAGQVAGHETVAEAIADDRVRAMVQALWADAARTVDLPSEELEEYQEALLARFANPRLADRLLRIAMDSSVKLPVRHLGVLADLGGPQEAPGVVRAVAGWTAWATQMVRRGEELSDPQAEAIARAVGAEGRGDRERVTALVGLLGDETLRDAAGGEALVEAVQRAEAELPRPRPASAG